MTKSLLLALGLMIAGQSFAATTALECRQGEKIVFEGLIRTDLELTSRIADDENLVIGFRDAISAKPAIVIDRRTLQRSLGVVLPNCKAPYARVFERMGLGNLRCTKIQLEQRRDMLWTNEILLGAIAGAEASCSVVLQAKSIQKLR